MSGNEMNFANLMDLASIDTSDLSAQTSRLQKQGIYVLDLSELKFVEQPPQDPADPMNYNLTTKGMILAFAPLDPNEPGAAEMEGRELRERIFLYGKDLREGIQLLMGRFKIVGFKHKGVMGGVEGGPAGWVDEAVGKRIAIRVRHYTNKGGQEQAAIDWLSPKQMEKAGLTWDVLQRDFLDEKGEPVQQAA
jgi:hypothetical protein